MLLLNHLIEPNHLLLSWQALESSSRSRFIVGCLNRESEDTITFKYFIRSSDYTKAIEHGFRGYPAFYSRSGAQHVKSVFSKNVLPTFMKRLPPKSRADYGCYLNRKGLCENNQLSDFGLLGYLGGKLPGDGFELIHTFDGVTTSFEFMIEVAGFRYESDLPIAEIRIGSGASFICDPQTKWDPRAIKVVIDGHSVGFVDHARVELFHRLFDDGANVGARVFSTNGSSKRPLVYLHIEVTWPSDLHKLDAPLPGGVALQ